MTKGNKLVLTMILGTSLLALGLPNRAWCQSGATGFLTSYYDVATSSSPSASGYGGGGASGGAGDALVRIANPTHTDTRQLGTLCAMIYVFDDIEEMQACCGCPVTPDGLRTASVINNLTKNFGVNRGNLNAGVIDIVSNGPNLRASKSKTLPAQIGAIGIGQGGAFFACDPSGQYGPTVGATSLPLVPEPGLLAYQSHVEGNVPVPATATLIKGTTVEEFSDAISDQPHLNNLQNFCLFLITNGSGAGACSCGAGDIRSKQ